MMASFTQLKRPFVGVRPALAARPSSARPRIAVRPNAASSSERPLWLPGTVPPPWLKGELPGDRGFDPLNFGTDEKRLQWFKEAELTNGRWAMAAVAGILGQELLGVQPKWFAAGAKEYIFPATALVGIEFLTLGFLELKRYQGYKATGGSGFLNWYPFDPLKLDSESNKVKEVKNGRLAMVAFVGFAVQALVTRQGPIEGLQSHLSSPFSNNIIGSIAHIPETIGQTGL